MGTVLGFLPLRLLRDSKSASGKPNEPFTFAMGR